MTYGLSRDDAGRFNVDLTFSRGVFPEDPFHMLDRGRRSEELLQLGARGGRQHNLGLRYRICGEPRRPPRIR